VKFRLNLDNNPIEWGIALMPGYEGPEIAFLAEGLSEGSTFIDIGANVGLYGLSLAKAVGPKGKVVCIEADPVAGVRVTENARLNAFPQVKVVLCAAGDRNGEARFSAKQNPAHSKVSDEGEVVVPMRTLEGILKSHQVKAIDALKIDVEGFEDQVLRPFFETAPKQHWPRRVVIEDLFIDEAADNIVKHMKRLGYREAGRNRINAFLVLD
jgi:FkbM family methyltransferase